MSKVKRLLAMSKVKRLLEDGTPGALREALRIAKRSNDGGAMDAIFERCKTAFRELWDVAGEVVAAKRTHTRRAWRLNGRSDLWHAVDVDERAGEAEGVTRCGRVYRLRGNSPSYVGTGMPEGETVCKTCVRSIRAETTAVLFATWTELTGGER